MLTAGVGLHYKHEKGVIDTGNHILDLVITHYKSPFSLGKPWFDMLSLQRNVNFDDIGVILVNDGEESRLPDELFKDYPFEVKNLTIPHAGVSGARNAGIDASDAEWVMICDFDDSFMSVNGLHILLTAAKDKTKVMYWSHFFEEIQTVNGDMIYHQHGRDYIFIHGKMFRVEWLRKENLRFYDKLTLHEDVFFNTLTQAVADDDAIGEIKSGLYIWCWNKDSVSRQYDNWLIRTYNHQIRQRIAIARELEQRGLDEALDLTVVKTIIDGYYDFQQESWLSKDLSKDYRLAERWFCTFMKEYWRVYSKVEPKKIAGMAKLARDYRVEKGFLLMESKTLRDWLMHMVNDVKPIPKEEWNL